MSVTPILQPSTAVSGAANYRGRYQDIFGSEGFLNKYNVERVEEIDLLGLATISGIDLLFLGDPGVGKTWAIELLVNHGLTGMNLFNHLLAKDQSAAELLGPKDVMAMTQGVEARMTKGYLPEANYAYLDEVFKASPPMLNPLLDIGANRKLKVGGKVIDCSQLLSIFMSSNELPDREDLAAFRDRIAITKFVQPVRTPEGRRAVTDIQLAYDENNRQVDTTGLNPLSLDDIYAIRAEVAQVQMPDAIRNLMSDIEQACLEAGHPISQRRKRDILRVVKARAWTQGRGSVVADDFLPAQHMDWNLPDHAASGRQIILDRASVFMRKASRLKEAMEPVAAALEELRVKLQATTSESDRDDLIDNGGGFRFLRQLKRLSREGQDQIAEGQAQGQDTAMIAEVVAEIDRAHEWAENMLASGGAA